MFTKSLKRTQKYFEEVQQELNVIKDLMHKSEFFKKDVEKLIKNIKKQYPNVKVKFFVYEEEGTLPEAGFKIVASKLKDKEDILAQINNYFKQDAFLVSKTFNTPNCTQVTGFLSTKYKMPIHTNSKPEFQGKDAPKTIFITASNYGEKEIFKKAEIENFSQYLELKTIQSNQSVKKVKLL